MTTIDLTRYRPSPSSPDGREYLGKVLERRRNELSLSRGEVSERGGPTHQTVYELERGKKSRVNLRTLRALEKALELATDTIVEQVLYGNPPVTLSEPVVPAPPEPPATEPDAEQTVSREALHSMMLTMGRLYGRAMIMEVAAQVVEELGRDNTFE